MSETVGFSVTSGVWTEVADGSENVLVATNSQKDFCVHVATSAPAVGAAVFSGSPDRSVSLSGLDASDKVYVRAGASACDVTVLRS